jgi:hypothetical protein
VSEFKVGDKVWVQATVERIEGENLRLTFCADWTLWFWASDCRPVEPPSKKPTLGQKLAEQALKGIWAANDAVNGTPVIKESLTTEPNCPEIPDSSSDPINPAHYKQGGIECIEAIKAALGDGFPDYLRGNVMKYLWRYKEKGGVDDLRKSAWYLDRLIQKVGE